MVDQMDGEKTEALATANNEVEEHDPSTSAEDLNTSTVEEAPETQQEVKLNPVPFKMASGPEEGPEVVQDVIDLEKARMKKASIRDAQETEGLRQLRDFALGMEFNAKLTKKQLEEAEYFLTLLIIGRDEYIGESMPDVMLDLIHKAVMLAQTVDAQIAKDAVRKIAYEIAVADTGRQGLEGATKKMASMVVEESCSPETLQRVSEIARDAINFALEEAQKAGISQEGINYLGDTSSLMTAMRPVA